MQGIASLSASNVVEGIPSLPISALCRPHYVESLGQPIGHAVSVYAVLSLAHVGIACRVLPGRVKSTL